MSKTVRYTTTDVNIRSSAAGSVVRALDPDSLVIHDSSDAPVVRALNGTTYTWLKVTYFYPSAGSNIVDASATGWLARENTATVPTSRPTKSQTYKSNRRLTQREMLVNARYIFNYLYNQPGSAGWAAVSILGMFGNMEQESTFNPGRWQDGVVDTQNSGFGLVQWTPPTKYLDWIPSSASRDDIDYQLKRILYEVQNEIQWCPNKHSPSLTFEEYTHVDNLSVQECAEYFLRCYEMPSNVTGVVDERGGAALKWSTIRNAMAGKF